MTDDQSKGKGLCLALKKHELIIISDGTDPIILEYVFEKKKNGKKVPRLRILATQKYKIHRVDKRKSPELEGESE